MLRQFEIVTGEGHVYGPFTLREMLEFAARLPDWICWQARSIGA